MTNNLFNSYTYLRLLERLSKHKYKEKKLKAKEGLGNRNLMRLYMGQSWLARKIMRHKQKNLFMMAKEQEIANYGQTVHALKQLGKKWVWI